MADMSFTMSLSALFSMNYAVPVKISLHPEICSVTLYIERSSREMAEISRGHTD